MGKKAKIDDITNYSKEELKSWIRINNGSGYKSRERLYNTHFPDIYNKIVNHSSSENWNDLLYNYLNDIKENPTCKHCGKTLHVRIFHYGYPEFCSVSCSNKSIMTIEKYKQNCLKKYGVDNVGKIPEIKNKIREVNTKNGNWAENAFEVNAIKNEIRINKYKDDISNFTKEEIKEWLRSDNESGSKSREDWILSHYPDLHAKVIEYSDAEIWHEKLYNYLNDLKENPKCCCGNILHSDRYSHGYDKYCSIECMKKSDERINNIRKTNIERYGVECVFQASEIKDKIKETCLKKYGVENHMQFTESKEKYKKTNLDKYGVENIFQNPLIREKIKETNLKKYGFAVPTQNPEIRKKMVNTIIERYGVDHYSKTDEYKIKVVNTKILRYGDKNYYNHEKSKKTNLDKYGVEFYMNSDDFKTKSKNTALKKYGELLYIHSVKYKTYVIDRVKLKYSKLLSINVNDIEYDGNNFIIKNYCKEHDEFIINKDSLKSRLINHVTDICTKCNPISENSSIKEIEIRRFINEDLNIMSEKTKIKNIDKSKTKNIISNQEIDIYIPSHKLGIEFDGIYHHCNLFKEQNYHLNKTNICEMNNIQLLHIFENEWINKKNIVKSIIKSKLGLIDDKIYAKNCDVKEITDDQIVQQFLDLNHIQGFAECEIKLGLYYNDELVSVMTFSKPRKFIDKSSNDNCETGIYEIYQFCDKINTHVIEGNNKLLKYFIELYNPKLITVYVDRRYSNGDECKELGFKFKEILNPESWYFRSHEYILYHNSEFNKDLLNENNYYKIYDCGYVKFEMEL